MIIQSTNVYYEEKLQPLQIEMENGKIKSILPYGFSEEAVDYQNAVILPGLIDIHNHGYFHGQCNNATKQWLKEWTSYLPSEGVTSTMFSFSCGDHDALFESLKVYDEFCKEEHFGTQLVGAYSEGPFVGKKPGAQNLAYKVIPTREVIDAYNEACGNRLLYVMVAPEELNGDFDVIRYCRQKGMKVAIGHSGADFATCAAAIEAGATSFTHTYNGMTGLHHREPGVLGAAMFHDQCYAELVCDGVHVHPVAANILARTKGKDRLILITDSVYVKGFEPGQYTEDGETIVVDEMGHVTKLDGTISGSCNRLNKVLEFAIKEAKIDPVTAYNACTKNPCELLGLQTKGKIMPGYDADLAVFDENYDVLATYINGVKFEK